MSSPWSAIMRKYTVTGLFTYLIFFSFGTSGCPEFLDVEMRKLGSKEKINFCESYSGKTLLIVNTASNCGYAHQFTELERLHQRYKEADLAVIGFSSDDFFQEEDDEDDAATICYDKYEVTFPVIATTSVRGENANQVFRALGEARGYPTWNFNKYLVGADGDIHRRFKANISPDHPKLRRSLQSLLPTGDK